MIYFNNKSSYEKLNDYNPKLSVMNMLWGTCCILRCMKMNLVKKTYIYRDRKVQEILGENDEHDEIRTLDIKNELNVLMERILFVHLSNSFLGGSLNSYNCDNEEKFQDELDKVSTSPTYYVCESEDGDEKLIIYMLGSENAEARCQNLYEIYEEITSKNKKSRSHPPTLEIRLLNDSCFTLFKSLRIKRMHPLGENVFINRMKHITNISMDVEPFYFDAPMKGAPEPPTFKDGMMNDLKRIYAELVIYYVSICTMSRDFESRYDDNPPNDDEILVFVKDPQAAARQVSPDSPGQILAPSDELLGTDSPPDEGPPPPEGSPPPDEGPPPPDEGPPPPDEGPPLTEAIPSSEDSLFGPEDLTLDEIFAGHSAQDTQGLGNLEYLLPLGL